MINLVCAIIATLHFWRTRAEVQAESTALARQAARLRELERHPELLTGGPSEWDRRH